MQRDKMRAVQQFKIDVSTGWMKTVRRVTSPNCDRRPPACLPELIVVHGISLPPGSFGGPWVERLFTNALPPSEHPYFAEICHLRVSAHAFIARTGGVTQFVSFNERAWHAGESDYCGRTACNDFSIGIELEGTDDSEYEFEQYASLVALISALRAAYPSLVDAAVVGHSDIAPGRRTDPGGCFDWARLEHMLSSVEACGQDGNRTG
jgi:AmpD protein